MAIKLVRDKISFDEIKGLAEETFGDFVKAAVDIEREILAVGGELHADDEAMLLQNESKQADVWGINIYPGKEKSEWIEFDSMINVRPSQGNSSRHIENKEIQEKIKKIVEKLIE